MPRFSTSISTTRQEETRNREFGALNSVPDQFRKMVLSMDKADFSAGGIVHRYLPDFLPPPSRIDDPA